MLHLNSLFYFFVRVVIYLNFIPKLDSIQLLVILDRLQNEYSVLRIFLTPIFRIYIKFVFFRIHLKSILKFIC